MYPTHWDLRDGKPSDRAWCDSTTMKLTDFCPQVVYRLEALLIVLTNIPSSNFCSPHAQIELIWKCVSLSLCDPGMHPDCTTQDLRFTTHVINNLLYVSSQRKLLYVTDVTTYGNNTATSHSFEHLSCFFPGLLALGAHFLPLNNLEAIGINITQLGDDLPPKYRRGYEALAGFDLADLHMWAAEGIAQTCYLSYADQPSGLGPDTIAMRIGKPGEIRWMDAMQRWKASGQLGSPPGVGDKRPWVANPKAKTFKQKQTDTITRDYSIRNTAYYLRPEV